MKKEQYYIITVIAAVISFYVLEGCNSYADKKPVTHLIAIKQMSFSPAELTVNKGDKLIFINQDIVDHNITENTKAWSSSILQPDQQWEITVTSSVDYYCSLHPVMKGKIIAR